MGVRHADNVFAWYKYSSAFPLTEALYIGFEAKKRSEMAGGVGRSTDILIIDENGIKEICPESVNLLEEIYHDREQKSERAGFDKRITELKIQTSDLESPQD